MHMPFKISANAVWEYLLRENLNTRRKRGLWAEAQGKPVLTEKGKLCMQARKNHINFLRLYSWSRHSDSLGIHPTLPSGHFILCHCLVVLRTWTSVPSQRGDLKGEPLNGSSIASAVGVMITPVLSSYTIFARRGISILRSMHRNRTAAACDNPLNLFTNNESTKKMAHPK